MEEGLKKLPVTSKENTMITEIQNIDGYNPIITAETLSAILFYRESDIAFKKTKDAFENVAELRPNVIFARINVDNIPEITKRNVVTNVTPTILVFRSSHTLAQLVYIRTPEPLLEYIDKYIDNATPV